jgi:hypothetical protein
MINRVSQSTQLVSYDDFTPHQGEFEFGNNAMIDSVSQHTQQLSYDGAPSNPVESALFFGNDSKIDRALIDGHYKKIILYKGVPNCRAVSEFIGNARRGPSAFVGNDSTMTRHQEQLLYDDVTSR